VTNFGTGMLSYNMHSSPVTLDNVSDYLANGLQSGNIRWTNGL